MKYRVYFQPLDVEGVDRDDAVRKMDEGIFGVPDISKILPVDEDGFVINVS